MQPKDFIDDQNPDYLLKLDQEGKIPEYVKSSSLLSKTDIDELHPYAFADTYNRAFPCHTKSATFLSAAYYAGRHLNNPQLKQAIIKHAAAHNISEDVNAAFEAFEPKEEKQASAPASFSPDDFALQLSRDGKTSEFFFPVRTEFEVLSSGDQLNTAYSSQCLPEAAMRKAARVVVKRASDFGIPAVTLPGYVRMFGEERLPDMDGISKIASSRAVHVDDYMQVVNSVLDLLTKAASVEEGIQIASNGVDVICTMDRANDVHYSPSIPHPQSLIFGGPSLEEFYKTASSLVPVLGVNVPASAVAELPDRTIMTHFPAHIAPIIKEAKMHCEQAPSMESMEKAASLIGSLEQDTQKHLLSVLLQEN